MPEKMFEIRDGRRYLFFDDPKEQAFYDKLFRLGDRDQEYRFDVTSAADLHKLARVDEIAQTVSYPVRFDDKPSSSIYSGNYYERTEDGRLLMVFQNDDYALQKKSGELPENLGRPRTEWLDDLKATDPAAFDAIQKEHDADVAESYMRVKIKGLMKDKLMVMDRASGMEPQILEMSGDKMEMRSFVKKPEQPTLPSGWKRFWNTVSGGRWYKADMEAYSAGMEKYEKEMAIYKAQELYRSTAKNEWPAYETECKPIPKHKVTQNDLDYMRLEEEERSLRQVNENITALFGPEPAMKHGVPEDFQTIIDTTTQASAYRVPDGMTPQQAAVVAHLCMNDKDVAGSFLKASGEYNALNDPSIYENRAMQIGGTVGHLEDLQFGRSVGAGKSGMVKFTRGQVEMARLKAKSALEKYAEGDKEPLADLLHENLPMLTGSAAHSTMGTSTKYAGALQETEQMFNLLRQDTALRNALAAKAHGTELLLDLDACHSRKLIYDKAMEAEKKLTGAEKLSKNERENLMADVALNEYLGAQSKHENDELTAKKTDEAIASLPELYAKQDNTGMTANEIQSRNNMLMSLQIGKVGGEVLLTPSSKEFNRLSDPETVERLRNTVREQPLFKEIIESSNPVQAMNDFHKDRSKQMEARFNEAMVKVETTVEKPQKAEQGKKMEKLPPVETRTRARTVQEQRTNTSQPPVRKGSDVLTRQG